MKNKILLVLLSFALFSCGRKVEEPPVYQHTVENEPSVQKLPKSNKTLPEKRTIENKDAYCQVIGYGKTPNAIIIISLGCFGPKKTRPITYYIRISFDKEKSLPSAHDTVDALRQFRQKTGYLWTLGAITQEKCYMRRNKLHCTYVYQLVVKDNSTEI